MYSLSSLLKIRPFFFHYCSFSLGLCSQQQCQYVHRRKTRQENQLEALTPDGMVYETWRRDSALSQVFSDLHRCTMALLCSHTHIHTCAHIYIVYILNIHTENIYTLNKNSLNNSHIFFYRCVFNLLSFSFSFSCSFPLSFSLLLPPTQIQRVSSLLCPIHGPLCMTSGSSQSIRTMNFKILS